MNQNFQLTTEQQALVSKHLSIVHWIISSSIHVNHQVCGLEYSDLFQEGCLWLCKAAATYRPELAQFETYAKHVVRNGLLSYCRQICCRSRRNSRLVIGEHGELAADGEELDIQADNFDSDISLMETLDLLESCKQDYCGVARLGIEAIALRIQGMRVIDIAKLYQVPPSHVGAWISRSATKLRQNPKFLSSIC